MDDIAHWLEQQDLGKYTQQFVENEIDLSVLTRLSEQDLKELGLPLGARRKLQAAIERLPDEASSTPAQDHRPQGSANDAERRQLTIMFCDLVGSTALSEQLDPEELREVNRAFQDLAKAEIELLDGFVARYMGDGILAYFGYPRAHEDDAERAIKVGLNLIGKVPELKVPGTDDRLGVRVGIATGPVVVGDLIGEGAAQESAVVGRAPNLAARLQGLAPENGVVVAPDTYSLARQFAYEDLGEHTLKGLKAPVRVRRVIGTRATGSRFESTHRSKLSGFVGRAAEIALLGERWASACTGEGQVVLLCGEAGIGKSRIVQTFCSRTEVSAHTRQRYQCSPHHLSSALFPVVAQLELEAGYTSSTSDAIKLAGLEQLLERTGQSDPKTVRLLAELLSIQVSDQYPNLVLSPQERKTTTFTALLGRLRGLSNGGPLLLVFEDLHWTDPTTAEFVSLIVDAAAKLPVLLLITFRPEFVSPWLGHPHVTTLTLNRLTRSQSESLVLDLTGGMPLPAELMEQVIGKTDGIPLFIEELTKSVLESDLVKATHDALELTGSLSALAIPSSLQDSLMARLDRLSSLKEVAQIGAAIGREFSYSMIQAVSRHNDAWLRDALAQLVDAELIFQHGDVDTATFTFKHALVQDTAYGSLLKTRRQQLHADIARVILDHFPQQAKTQPELLARHYAAAGLPEPAANYWLSAANVALAKSAYLEAVASLDEALHQLLQLPEGQSRDRLELDLQVKKLGALFPVKGWAAPECDEAASRTLDLYHRVGGDPALQFGALYVRWGGKNLQNAQREAYTLSREYLELALATKADAPTVIGHRIHGVSLLMRGEVEAARKHLRTALELYNPARHMPQIGYFGQDLKVQACNFLALSEALLGAIDTATLVAKEGIAQSWHVTHLSTLAYGLWHLRIWLPAMLRNSAALAQGVVEVRALSREHKLAFWETLCEVFPNNDAGLKEIKIAETAVIRCRTHFKMHLLVPENLCHIGAAYLAAGAIGDARRVIEEARYVMTQTGALYWESEALRLTALLAIATNRADVDKAVTTLSQAIALANKRQISLLELRAATDLARLSGENGNRVEGRDALAAVYARFTEGFESPDLTDARTLLKALA